MERDQNSSDGLQDFGTGLLEELLGFFESEATILDSQIMSRSFSMSSSTFQSAIKFHGRPILPPVMTDERFEEMAMYKRQAIFTETRLKARGRQKLLSRVQSIVDNMNRPSSLKSSQGRTSPQSDTAKVVRPTSPPNISDEPATDITRPISQESIPSIAPDSLEIEAKDPKVSKVVPQVKTSPRSEAKDSGFSSQSQVKDSIELSTLTTDHQSEEPQDTMAEIDDISDDDLGVDAAISAEPIKISVNEVPARPRTVAERLGSAFESLRKGDEQSSKPPTVNQMSARSSVSGTASTTSTDTTLQDTVLVQGPPPGAEAQSMDGNINESTENQVAKSLDKTDETMESVGIENGFEPLSSTRSLLSRVAFNLDDDESPEYEVQPMKIGDISKISCSLKSQDTNAVMESVDVDSSVVNHPETKSDPEQPSLVREEANNLSVGPTVTPDVSQIEASPDDSVVPEEVPDMAHKPTLPEVQAITATETTEGSSLKSESEQPVCQSVFPPSTHNQSDVSSGAPDSTQDVAESTNLTMYTTSTDIDKYMQGSQDTDTIRSSMTTLPHILDDSISEIGLPLTQATSVAQENLPDARLSATMPNTLVSVAVDTLNTTGNFEPPKPTASVSSPEKMEPQAKDRTLRRGSYTVDSPSTGVLRRASYTVDSPSQAIHRRGSYTLESPSPALLLATQNTDNANKETERPKSALGITEPTSCNMVRDHMNRSQAQSEPARTTEYALTSSMEDLKLRPVQRTLNFDYDSESNHTQTQSERNNQNIESRNIGQVPPQPVTVGKEEHLQRYLQTLSQMPQLNPNQTSVSESVQSSPKEKTSETSSPGQVDPRHMNGVESLVPVSGVEMDSTGGVSEDSLSRSMQMEFENLQSQLMEQQQQQLSQLLQEQQRQQMVMQQEFLRYESMLLESSATDQDALLYQQLQDRQRELLQQQMAMQQQLRWQMQQQRQQLQAQLLYLKQSQGLPLKADTGAKPANGINPAMAKKTKRKKWQEPQRTDDWVIEAQSETASVTSDSNVAESSTLSVTGVAQADIPPSQRYFSDILPGDQTQYSTDTTSSAYFMPASRNRNRSGVSLGSDPFATQRSESGMSTNTDVHGLKKRVSFSTDIDAGSETGSLTSRSTSRSGPVSEALAAGHYRVGGQYFPVPSIEPLLETAESSETSILSSVANSPTRLAKAGYTQSPVSSITSSKISKSSRGSPRSPRHVAMSGPKISIYDPVPPELQKKFDRVSAAAKGYLTRRLMRSDKVGQIIKTITDTAEFAINFQRESPIKQGQCTNQDKELVERVLAQLTAALYEIHEIFFELPIAEKMSLIAQTRASERERLFKQKQAKKNSKRLSSATMKALERKKKAQAAEMAAFGNLRPKSCPPATSSPVADKRPDLTGPLRRNYQYMMSKVVKPMQSHLSPIKPVKDTLNRNPLRSSYDKLYTRALKRAVAMEKKEQREKAILKQKPLMINIKNVKPRIDSHLGPKKTPSSNNNNTVTIPAQNKPPSSTRSKSAQSTHPWK